MNKPEVYLDLDGVVADFFTEYAKLAGIESGNYRDIPPAKTDPTLNKMVGTDFFNRLPKCPNADQLVHMIIKLYGHYHVCSSPLRGDFENSEKWKKVWIARELKPGPVDVIITPNKAKYAKQKDGTPNILIDERGSNITAWEAAGGIGIKYQADEDSLSKIVDGFSRARKIIKGEEKHVPQNLISKTRNPADIIQTPDKPSSAADVQENGEINPRFQSKPMMANENIAWGEMDPGAARQMLAAYRHFAPGIERFRDEEGANRLYKELNNIAVQTKQQNAFKSMIASARGWAHMEYDTNPGGFQNWFWALEGMLEKIAEDDEAGGIEIGESASAGATGSGSIASAPAAGGGWLFGGTVGAPKGAKKKKAKVIKR